MIMATARIKIAVAPALFCSRQRVIEKPNAYKNIIKIANQIMNAGISILFFHFLYIGDSTLRSKLSDFNRYGNIYIHIGIFLLPIKCLKFRNRVKFLSSD